MLSQRWGWRRGNKLEDIEWSMYSLIWTMVLKSCNYFSTFQNKHFLFKITLSVWVLLTIWEHSANFPACNPPLVWVESSAASLGIFSPVGPNCFLDNNTLQQVHIMLVRHRYLGLWSLLYTVTFLFQPASLRQSSVRSSQREGPY